MNAYTKWNAFMRRPQPQLVHCDSCGMAALLASAAVIGVPILLAIGAFFSK